MLQLIEIAVARFAHHALRLVESLSLFRFYFQKSIQQSTAIEVCFLICDNKVCSGYLPSSDPTAIAVAAVLLMRRIREVSG